MRFPSVLLVFVIIGSATTFTPADGNPVVAPKATLIPKAHSKVPPPYPIPSDGSVWKELFPNFDVDNIQQAYVDNGDGVVSAADILTLSTAAWGEADWLLECAGRVYVMSMGAPMSGDSWPFTTPENHDPTSPVGETWKYGYGLIASFRVTAWADADFDGMLGPGDSVADDATPPMVVYVDYVADTYLSYVNYNPVETSTWGQIKRLMLTVLPH